MEKVVLENVRCFRSRVEAPIARITLLVGENSTGKSSFLALLRVASDVATSRQPSFNLEPFQLGSFDSIAHYHGGRGKRATSFTIGTHTKTSVDRYGRRGQKPSPVDIAVYGLFKPVDGQPRISEWNWTDDRSAVSVKVSPEGKAAIIFSVSGEHVLETETEWRAPFIPIAFAVQDALLRQATTKKAPSIDMRRIIDLTYRLANTHSAPYSIAPIRTRPERTYDPIRDEPTPEGQHIPVVLSQLSSRKNTDWTRIKSTLQQFGEASGLYSSIDIRHLGKKKTADPFQLEVELRGQQGRRNVIDVGYGVSQVLPILVESLVQPPSTMLLVQQPEVHLHPRAQAELGTFIAKMAKERDLRFVIETHSDYLIDRIAMAIREGILEIDDVALLFFEPAESEVRVNPLAFDDKGNIGNAPSGYRSFFLDEQVRYLGG